MKNIVALDFQEASEICKPFTRLQFPKDIESLLNSGNVLFYFRTIPPSNVCWPSFPIGNHRMIVKQLKNEGFLIPESVKVIIEVGMFYGDKEITKFVLDCFGHTILYLLDPKASNECEDATRLIKQLKIRQR